jgi:hypothetical protein
MIQANDLKGSTPSNVTKEPMFIRWWLLFVHKKVASIPNIQMHSYHNHALYHVFSYTSIHAYTRLRNIGPPSRIHDTRLEKRLENEERLHPKAQYQRKLEGVWNDVAHLIGLLKQMF